MNTRFTAKVKSIINIYTFENKIVLKTPENNEKK